MKTAKFSLGLILAIFVTLTSCSKDEDFESVDSSNGSPTYDVYIVYGSKNCKTELGEAGVKCVVVTDDDDCDELADCEAKSTLLNYNQALEDMFTDAEIEERANSGVPITEPELRAALILDGFPLKASDDNDEE